MTVNPTYLSNNFIERALRERIPLSPMKLQKILYFTYRDYLKKTGVPLFTERFSTWKYGPVLESVYHQFKSFRSSSISNFAPDVAEDGKISVYKINETYDTAITNSLNSIWEQCKDLDGIVLSEITHQPGSAWYRSFQAGSPVLDDRDIKNDITVITQ